jgi:SpoIIAA-like
MPVLWSVSHSTRLVAITVKGAIRLEDMEECVAGILTPATLSYRKLVDMTEGAPALSWQDIRALAEQVRERAGRSPLGALAIVAVSAQNEQQARLLGSVSDRPWKLFRDVQSAQAWLDIHPWRPPQFVPETAGPGIATTL